MKTLNATEFKAKCLEILEHLSPEGLVITKRGQPVARVLPYRAASLRAFYGCMRGSVKAKGDLYSTGVKWNAES